jgi:glycosyltransferase involved in cell wall biosynthesis
MISIIIPTLNEESVIGETVSDLQAKLTIPHEIIISDGQSKDRTVELARSAGAKVVEYTGTIRQTIAKGRNDGAKAASGEFLVFIDADCTIREPDKFFTRIIDHFQADPKLVAVNVAIRVLPEMETFSDRLIFDIFNDYLWIVNNFIHVGISAGEFQMIRKSVFDRLGGYNEKLVASEDMDMFSRLAKVGRVRFDKGLTIYHTGRRGHAVGWPKLLSLWLLNSVWMMTSGRAFVSEWKPIRSHKKI